MNGGRRDWTWFWFSLHLSPLLFWCILKRQPGDNQATTNQLNILHLYTT